MAEHNIAAGRTDTGHVAVCICGWRLTGPDLDTMASAIGLHFIATEDDTDKPPKWAQEIFEAYGVTVERLGMMREPIWGCTEECSCLLVISDGMFIDRYSYMSPDGPCGGLDCPCHALPRERPEESE